MSSPLSNDSPLSERLIALQEGCNFRDFGGYATTDDRRVRSGRLFRCGVLAHLTAADWQRVGPLGIRRVIDLRRDQEREREPTRWPFAETSTLFRDHELDHAASNASIRKNGATAATARASMIALYRSMPRWLADRMRDLLTSLSEAQTPLLMHCSAGKDRTGFGAALVLETLGVPREQVLQDYALTNQAVDLEAFVLRHHESGMGLTDAEHPLLSIPRASRDALLAADVDYLLAALERIEQEFGSVLGYVSTQLGLDERAIERLRSNLLE